MGRSDISDVQKPIVISVDFQMGFMSRASISYQPAVMRSRWLDCLAVSAESIIYARFEVESVPYLMNSSVLYIRADLPEVFTRIGTDFRTTRCSEGT